MNSAWDMLWENEVNLADILIPSKQISEESDGPGIQIWQSLSDGEEKKPEKHMKGKDQKVNWHPKEYSSLRSRKKKNFQRGQNGRKEIYNVDSFSGMANNDK